MEIKRKCSKPGCNGNAVGTLTFVYADSTAVLGQLSTYAEPHAYDLCRKHTERLNVPKGWDVLRLEIPDIEKTEDEDLLAIADVLKEEQVQIKSPREEKIAITPPKPTNPPGMRNSRNHLRIIPNSNKE
ncbi:MAG: DUF3499 domain-containing protein [Micrococcaceae bacterium]